MTVTRKSTLCVGVCGTGCAIPLVRTPVTITGLSHSSYSCGANLALFPTAHCLHLLGVATGNNSMFDLNGSVTNKIGSNSSGRG